MALMGTPFLNAARLSVAKRRSCRVRSRCGAEDQRLTRSCRLGSAHRALAARSLRAARADVTLGCAQPGSRTMSAFRRRASTALRAPGAWRRSRSRRVVKQRIVTEEQQDRRRRRCSPRQPSAARRTTSAASKRTSSGRLIPAGTGLPAYKRQQVMGDEKSETFAPPTYARAVPIDIAAAVGED